MIDWTSRERWHLRLDPHLRRYVTQIVHVVGDRPDADVLDVAAGSGWLGQLSFRSYTPVDIVPPHETWDLDTPLPDHHVGRYDLVTCLGALHFTTDPRRSLGELARALRPGGELLVAVPWLYPPHDPGFDLWRISPRLLWRLMDERFGAVDLYPHGTVFDLPLHVVNRYVSGPFRGVAREDIARLRDAAAPEVWHAAAEADVPHHRFGPVGVLAHGRSPHAG